MPIKNSLETSLVLLTRNLSILLQYLSICMKNNIEILPIWWLKPLRNDHSLQSLEFFKLKV